MSQRKRAPKKPSGIIGPLRVTMTTGGPVAEQQKICWPEDQKGIENAILAFFVREFERTGATFLKIEDGGIDRLDFLLTLPGSQMYLELMEAVIPHAEDLPHQSGNQSHWPVPYADKIFESVQRKIDKYGFKHSTPVSILIYTTHEQYNPNTAAIHVLRHYFKQRPHAFFYAFFIVPSEAQSTIWSLFDRDHPYDPPPLEELAKQYWTNLPSSGGEVTTSPPPRKPT